MGMFMLSALGPHLINSLILGVIYILLALGLSLIFGLVGVINFAHGSFFALGAYFAYTLQSYFGFWGAALAALLIVGILATLIEKSLLRRLYDRDPLSGLLVTFGLALVLEDAIRTIWGPAGLPFDPPSYLSGLIVYGPIVQTKYRLVVLLIALIALAIIWFLLMRTRVGAVTRAGSRDPVMVQLLGINIFGLFTLLFGVGASLAALAGILAAPLWGLEPTLGAKAIMPSFVVVAIGGLGSLLGAVFAGLLIGLIVGMSVAFYPPIAEVSPYIAMATVLLFLPRGLLGKKWEKFE